MAGINKFMFKYRTYMKKLTTAEFITNFYQKYPDGLNLQLNKFQYATARNKSITICKTHNKEILNTANNLMQGIKRCPDCKSESISNSRSYTLDTFVEKSKSAHGNIYDYSSVQWKNSRIKVDIICNEHGVFSQNPQSHWNGYGCPKCGYKNLRKTKDEFVNEALKIHGNRYDYATVEYSNNYTKVEIRCKTHGIFYMTPKDHNVYQRGCPNCFTGNRSWVEISWLNSLNIPSENRQKYIKINNKRILVDALVDNTIYEFWGDFWHGNPAKFNPSDRNTKCGKTFGELYENTLKKRKLILDAGYSLIEIWESEYTKEH